MNLPDRVRTPPDIPDPAGEQTSDHGFAEEYDTATFGAAGHTVPMPEDPAFGPPAAAGELGTLGKYRLLKVLGRGGMGAVYLGFDEKLQRNAAVKVILPQAARFAAAKQRFLREARAAAAIDSDYVVGVYDADEADGVPFIAMQYLQGYPLSEYLQRKGEPPVREVARIGRETALGLAAAHALGLVHRDIKPGNLWLEAPRGRVKILDFGLAKPCDEADDRELTHCGALVGTPAYMAPEQARAEAVDGRTDLFSLGCTLYRLCTGKPPFLRPTVMATLMALASEDPVPVRDLNPAVPERLAEIIRQLLAKAPANRPADAAAVAEDLEDVWLDLGGGEPSTGSRPRLRFPEAANVLFDPPPGESAAVPAAPKVESRPYLDITALNHAVPAVLFAAARPEADPHPVRVPPRRLWLAAAAGVLFAAAGVLLLRAY